MEFYQHHIKKLKALVISKQLQIDTLYLENSTNSTLKDQQIQDLNSTYQDLKKTSIFQHQEIALLDSKIQKNDVEYDDLVQKFNELESDKILLEVQRDEVIVRGREEA